MVGEDLSEEAAAFLLRDMWKPDDFCGTALCARNPGKATSENYTCGSGDNGGVHANSSVPNHAFAMLVDGTAGQGPVGSTGLERDSYNGQSFPGIGMVKALHIYFHAQTNYQTPSTDFPQHADALRASCQDLKGLVLKDPTHLVHLDTVVAMFPEARLVFIHRDPAFAISSICSLYAYSRAILSDEVDPHALGAEIMDGYWPTAMDRALALRERLAPGRCVDVRHADLARDPIGTAAVLYRALGLELTSEARAAMQAFVARDAVARGTHAHSPEGFGLRRDAIRERFRDSIARFSL